MKQLIIGVLLGTLIAAVPLSGQYYYQKKVDNIAEKLVMAKKLEFLFKLNAWKDWQLQWVQRCTCLAPPDFIINNIACDQEWQQIQRDKDAIMKELNTTWEGKVPSGK